MSVQLLLFVIAILLFVVFWELCKINGHLKRTSVRGPTDSGETRGSSDAGESRPSTLDKTMNPAETGGFLGLT